MTMTDDRLALLELIEKRVDTDLIREMLGFAAGRVMELEMQACTGAAHGVRDPARQGQRDGYRGRGWGVRLGRGRGPATASGAGRPGRDGSSWRSPACAGAATSPPSWSPGARRR